MGAPVEASSTSRTSQRKDAPTTSRPSDTAMAFLWRDRKLKNRFIVMGALTPTTQAERLLIPNGDLAGSGTPEPGDAAI
jgi:hypothetical protein